MLARQVLPPLLIGILATNFLSVVEASQSSPFGSPFGFQANGTVAEAKAHCHALKRVWTEVPEEKSPTFDLQ